MKAKYECFGCKRIWEEELRGPYTQCPACPSKYMKWLNFDEIDWNKIIIPN